MKTILMGLALLTAASAFAQNNRDNRSNQYQNKNYNNGAPTEVQHSFQRDYPNAQNAQWNNVNGQWHGSYRDQNNHTADSYYNSNGQRIDTHTRYNENELPSPVKKKAKKKYHSTNNYEAYRIERPNAKPVYEINEGGHAKYYYENGKKTNYKDRH